MSWTKLPPLEDRDIHIGCLCCSSAARTLSMNRPVCVGFGWAEATKDGRLVYDGEQDARDGNEPKLVKDIETLAAADPDHDWRIKLDGPLHGETYQRHCDNTWVCIESNRGFA